jgi:hypothetical protein
MELQVASHHINEEMTMTVVMVQWAEQGTIEARFQRKEICMATDKRQPGTVGEGQQGEALVERSGLCALRRVQLTPTHLVILWLFAREIFRKHDLDLTFYF